MFDAGNGAFVFRHSRKILQDRLPLLRELGAARWMDDDDIVIANQNRDCVVLNFCRAMIAFVPPDYLFSVASKAPPYRLY